MEMVTLWKSDPFYAKAATLFKIKPYLVLISTIQSFQKATSGYPARYRILVIWPNFLLKFQKCYCIFYSQLKW